MAHPSLWPIRCICSTAKLGDASLQADGSFQFCFDRFPIFLLNCYKSYLYKVYQNQGAVSVCIYDGQAAGQYFAADDFANLSTLSSSACGTQPPIPGTDFVALQQIGATSTHYLHSNYGVPIPPAGPGLPYTDTTQTGAYSVAAPILANTNGGLVNKQCAVVQKTLLHVVFRSGHAGAGGVLLSDEHGADGPQRQSDRLAAAA
jgi:hypothetical protein